MCYELVIWKKKHMMGKIVSVGGVWSWIKKFNSIEIQQSQEARMNDSCAMFSVWRIQFAQSAKKIKNKPIVNEVMSDGALIKQYEVQIKVLTKQLQEVSAPEH